MTKPVNTPQTVSLKDRSVFIEIKYYPTNSEILVSNEFDNFSFHISTPFKEIKISLMSNTFSLMLRKTQSALMKEQK